MEISTFELLVKRIAPPPAPQNVARRVVQGYFLTITNLESNDLTFRIAFNISKPNPAGDPDRTLFKNAGLFFDIAGANNPVPLSGGANSTTFGGSFLLPAKQTASVELLPNQSLFADVNPDFEVRGYVTLRLPRIGRQPQSVVPVKVLLNPEIRGTFLPNGFPDGATEDFDQINYPLTVASGKGLNEIAPDPLFTFPSISPEILRSLPDDAIEALIDADGMEKSQTLIELMAQLDLAPQNLENLSDALSKLNIPVRVSSI
jgi:hypothetical protein